MFEYLSNQIANPDLVKGGKTIKELKEDKLNKSGVIKIPITAGKSIYAIRKEAGWPSYKGNTTDTYIINYIRDIEGAVGKKDSKITASFAEKNKKISIPTYKSYLEKRKNIGGTAIIIYANAKSSPLKKDPLSFKKSAERKVKILRKSGNYDEVILAECFTEKEFLSTVNKKYKNGKITRLEVFSHSTNNSIVLGDRVEPTNGKKYKYNTAAKDRSWFSRRDHTHKEESEVKSIDESNFRKDARVILWGCRQAGGNYKKTKKKTYEEVPISESFAKELADHLNVPVQAFFNTSRTPERIEKGVKKTYNPGYMVPEADAKEVMVMPD